MKVLMVCLGNICRSPLAEGILKEKLKQKGLSWQVDSAGTGGWHIGALPDQRSIQVAKKYGIDITKEEREKIIDFEEFDLIFAMDESNSRGAAENQESQIRKIFESKSFLAALRTETMLISLRGLCPSKATT
jgi:protein-tyrosine-phosphatase